jgi:hypothetical protein
MLHMYGNRGWGRLRPGRRSIVTSIVAALVAAGVGVGSATQSWYADGDGDGHGAGAPVVDPDDGGTYVLLDDDCDDADDTRHPGAVEVPEDGVDSDCDGDSEGGPFQNGSFEEGETTPWWQGWATDSVDLLPGDAAHGKTFLDMAGHSPGFVQQAFDTTAGTSYTIAFSLSGNPDRFVGYCSATDADPAQLLLAWEGDTTPDVFPFDVVNTWDDLQWQSRQVVKAATDTVSVIRFEAGANAGCTGALLDGITITPVSTSTPSTWYADGDGDGFGNPAVTQSAVTAPDGYVSNSSDCDDTTDDVRPGATEAYNGVDDDCDGSTDEGFYADVDNDDFGSTTAAVHGTHTDPETSTTDCNDGSATVYPGAFEAYNGMDDDCDGTSDEGFYADVDGDGYGGDSPATHGDHAGVANDDDCDDTDVDVHPAATEALNGADDNCNGNIDEGFLAASSVSYTGASKGLWTNKNRTVSFNATVGSLDDACISGRLVRFTVNGQTTSGISDVAGKAAASFNVSAWSLGPHPVQVSVVDSTDGRCAGDTDEGSWQYTQDKPRK